MYWQRPVCEVRVQDSTLVEIGKNASIPQPVAWCSCCCSCCCEETVESKSVVVEFVPSCTRSDQIVFVSTPNRRYCRLSVLRAYDEIRQCPTGDAAIQSEI